MIMKYTYEINSESKAIHVITTGDLITKEVASMGVKILLKAKELKYKVVFDYRFSKNRISIAEAYFWYVEHYDHVDVELRHIPIAYIVNNEDWNFYSFFECTCTNRGICVKLFKDENAIWEWVERF